MLRKKRSLASFCWQLPWLELDGVQLVGPAAASVAKVRLVGGTTDLTVDLQITGELESTGGTSSGVGAFVFSGTNTKTLDTQGNVIHKVRATEGLLRLAAFDLGTGSVPSMVGDFTLGGGHVQFFGGLSLLVTTQATLNSGWMSSSFQSGGDMRVEGTWAGNATFDPVNIGSVFIELGDGTVDEGAGDTLIVSFTGFAVEDLPSRVDFSGGTSEPVAAILEIPMDSAPTDLRNSTAQF